MMVRQIARVLSVIGIILAGAGYILLGLFPDPHEYTVFDVLELVDVLEVIRNWIMSLLTIYVTSFVGLFFRRKVK